MSFAIIIVGCYLADRTVKEGSAAEALRRQRISEHELGAAGYRAN